MGANFVWFGLPFDLIHLCSVRMPGLLQKALEMDEDSLGGCPLALVCVLVYCGGGGGDGLQLSHARGTTPLLLNPIRHNQCPPSPCHAAPVTLRTPPKCSQT